MKSKTFTVSASAGGTSVSPIYVPDRHVTPFNIGFGVAVASGTGTSAAFTIQHTFQDPLQVTAASLVWYSHDFVSAATKNVGGNYAFPVAGIRVFSTSAADGGASVTFIQAGIVG